MDPTLANSLYYTMSTVAQTLAGAMGLLGAIVLFAMQGTAKSIERAAKRLIKAPHGPGNDMMLRHLFTRGHFHELARRYGAHFEKGTNPELNLNLMEQYAALSWFLDHDRLLRRSFIRALIASGAIVSVALIGCALVPQLAERPALAHGLLVFVTVGAIVCLLLYGLLLKLMLATTPEDSVPEKRR